MFGNIEVGLHCSVVEIKWNIFKFSQLCLSLQLFPSPVNVAMVTTIYFHMHFYKGNLISFQKIYTLLPNSSCVKGYDQTTTTFYRLLLKLENGLRCWRAKGNVHDYSVDFKIIDKSNSIYSVYLL